MIVLTIYELRELVKLLEKTDVESIEVKNDESRIAIKRRIGSQGFANQGAVVASIAAAPAQKAPASAPLQAKPVAVEEKVRPIANLSKPTPVKQPEHTENLHKITSPMVGTFYKAPAVDAAPYVSVHDRVEKSTVVCIVEAMKLFNEIEAEVNGEIVEVLVENGQLVDQGQPLFLVKPTQ
jgi:acetyl-CoA carboxylase biotin carboxyl carrier protein